MSPLFSLVVAIHNVEEYIPDFLRSLDEQTIDDAAFEVILVDDGTPDDSAVIAEKWATERANTTVLHQENAGQGAARNAGLDVATGRWVTFCDPDDVLASNYLEMVAAFLALHEDEPPAMVATRILTFTESHLVSYDRHPLRSNFRGGDQLVDLTRFPERIHLSGGTSFLRRDLIADTLRFDTRIRPTFEDGHFVARFLVDAGDPIVGFVKSAEYYYRKRADTSSAVQSGWGSVDKYTTVLRRGYLDALEYAAARLGSAPLWLQNTVLYDIAWYFRADAQITSLTGSIPAATLAEFHDLMARIMVHIEAETVLAFRIIRMEWMVKRMLIAGYRGEPTPPEGVYFDRIDKAQRLVRARYYFAGEAPEEDFRLRGLPVRPAYAKTRALQAYGRTLLRERIVWLPTEGTLRATVGGRPLPLLTKSPEDPPYSLSPERLWRSLGIGRPSQTPVSRPSRARRAAQRLGGLGTAARPRFDQDQLTAKATIRYARLPHVRRRYEDAWILLDRPDQAQDNAEHFYRYLRRRRPAVNAFFVLERQSPDWARLKADGFRLVEFGSLEWRAAHLNAKHVVSSQANGFAVSPLRRDLYGVPRSLFTFLQHGVTKDDLSRWLNGKRIHLLTCATRPELESMIADDTPYALTAKEVRLTGFPRHDVLLEKASRASPADRQLLIMPTWRRSLTDGLPDGVGEDGRHTAFAASDFAKNWLALLRDPRLHALARELDTTLALMPHPNMEQLLRKIDLPPEIHLLSWATSDIQEEVAKSQLLITDYTSLAFDMALLRRSTVYFQFDKDAFFSGAQPFRRGYYDYERDAFGPVVTTLDECIAEVSRLGERAFEPDPESVRRMTEAFGEPDGHACSRVYQEIVKLDRQVKSRSLLL